MNKVKRICAWHKKYFGTELVMGEAESVTGEDTHGICPDCQIMFNAEVYVIDVIQKKKGRVDKF